MKKLETKIIEKIERVKSSVYGNPNFMFTFTDGTQARTQNNMGWAYAVGNSGMREGCAVMVNITPVRRYVNHMEPWTF